MSAVYSLCSPDTILSTCRSRLTSCLLCGLDAFTSSLTPRPPTSHYSKTHTHTPTHQHTHTPHPRTPPHAHTQTHTHTQLILRGLTSKTHDTLPSVGLAGPVLADLCVTPVPKGQLRTHSHTHTHTHILTHSLTHRSHLGSVNHTHTH